MEQENQEKIEQKVDNVVIGSKRFFIYTALTPVFFWLVMAVVYYFVAQGVEVSAIKDIVNVKVLEIFKTYYLYVGVVFGFLSMLGGLIVYLIFKLVRLAKFRVVYPVLVVLMAMPWYLFGRQLVFFEKRYTDIGRAIISFVGEPLLLTAKIMLGIAIAWLVIIILIWVIKKGLGKKAGMAVMFLIMPVMLSGCVGDIESLLCVLMGDDADHCYQGAAVQEGEVEECEKIKGEGFKGSNPPRDKCYLLIAENTGDLDACDHIKGGMMSYTREECILGSSIKNENPSGCKKLKGADHDECVTALGPKIDAFKVLEVDDQIRLIEEELKNGSDANLQKQLEGLEAKKKDMLDVMLDKNKKDYESLSDPMNKQVSMDYYSGRIDEQTKNSLVALNDSLRGKGEKLSETEYQALRDMLAYKNDPKNDIENMDPSEIVKLRWNEKVGNAVDYLKFWNSNSTEAEKKYDEQLLFYERMLERQVAIDEGLSEAQQDFDRNSGMVKDYLKDKAWDYAMDEAKKAAFDELMDLVESDAAGPVSAVLGEAIDTVKKEAKSAEFRGLVRAYNKGMEEELAKAGGNVDKAHEMVTANLQKDPYMYEDKNSFAKYGNILENKDCDGSNPHCIKRDVFWKAMKKSYSYQHK